MLSPRDGRRPGETASTCIADPAAAPAAKSHCAREKGREREGVRDIARKRKRQRQREKEESECKVPQASVVIILILMYNSYVEARIKMQVNAAYA